MRALERSWERKIERPPYLHYEGHDMIGNDMSQEIIHQIRDSTANISCAKLAEMLQIDVRKIRQLTKIQDELLRPPGYFVGKCEYRIWLDELPDYLHGRGRYEKGGFARALEAMK